jgi:hypothetical protein
MNATGTYYYNSATGILLLNLTNSDFIGCGPEAGESELEITSITPEQLTWQAEDGQMVWTRDSGTSNDILGTWTYYDAQDGNQYIIHFEAEGHLAIVGYINHCPEAETFFVPRKTIVIDGDFSDWQVRDRVYLDLGEPECENEPGLDIREFYVAQDADFIYYRFILNGPLNASFGYKFGTEHRYVYIGQDPFGAYMFYGNTYTYEEPFLPSGFLHIDANQFEAKFYKSDVENYWIGEKLSGWCDQATISSSKQKKVMI